MEKTKRHPGLKNLTGKRFGSLVVVSEAERKKRRPGVSLVVWNCVCDCGKRFAALAGNLNQGKTKSCGHSQGERHGRSNTKLYRIWRGIINRCENKNLPEYARYGGAGITLHKPWRNSFSEFRSAVGDPPSKIHSIDRYPNPGGNYEPGNVRWATSKEQSRNRKNGRVITVDGITKCLVEWSEESGIGASTISGRIKMGWPERDAIFTPLLK